MLNNDQESLLTSLSYELDKTILIGPYVLLNIDKHSGMIDGVFSAEMEGKLNSFGTILKVGLNPNTGKPYDDYFKEGDVVVFDTSKIRTEAGFYPYFRFSTSELLAVLK